MNKAEHSLEGACEKIMEALAVFLLKNDFGYKEFNELARWAFASSGAELLGIDFGENYSTRLGDFAKLTRNELSRASKYSPSSDNEAQKIWRTAMRVMHIWHTHPELLDDQGRPLVLDLGESTVYKKLFAEHEDRKRIVRELEIAKTIRKLSDNSWEAVTRYYLPKDPELQMSHFGESLVRLIRTLDNNLNQKGTRWLERMVVTADLKPEAHSVFRRVSKEQTVRHLLGLDDWLTSNELELNDTSEPRVELGVSAFYFEK